MTEEGYGYNNPLLVVEAGSHKGKLPPSMSFVSLSPSNLILTGVKKAEDSGAWIIQWYNAKGIATEAQLSLPGTPAKVLRSNFLEEDGEAVPFSGNNVRVPTGKNSVVTVKVEW
jgi:alpha-mannosidase